MSEYIRDVEKVIDSFHKTHPAFLLNQKTALYNALVVFEDMCRLGGSAEMLLSNDNINFSFLIKNRIDSLNMLVRWIYTDCQHSDCDSLNLEIIPDRYVTFVNLLENYAKPYSDICGAYIGYSRGKFTLEINKSSQIITFHDNPATRSITISDVAESMMRDLDRRLQFVPMADYGEVNMDLEKSINFVDDHITYSVESSIWLPFEMMMERQWNQTSELPETWKFEDFSLGDFKRFWIAIATLASIHMFACLKSGKTGAAVEDAVLMRSPAFFATFISGKSGISQASAETILHYLTFNSNIKNNDAVYQPLIQIDNDLLALAPHLILASRPERNLIALINKKKDKSYFTLTNLREGFMQDVFTNGITNISGIQISKNKALPGTLPDVDYSILDLTSNTVLVCELKWLVEPDSPQEVYSRSDDLEHGCNQITDILVYANHNKSDFCKRVFGIDCDDNFSFLGCVVSKKGIQVDNSEIPVISLPTIIELLQNADSVSNAFLAIQERTYLLSIPSHFEFGLGTVKYAGYTFEIPALKKERAKTNFTYRRVSHKVGRNDPCPCGSGKKYKKCCGR